MKTTHTIRAPCGGRPQLFLIFDFLSLPLSNVYNHHPMKQFTLILTLLAALSSAAQSIDLQSRKPSTRDEMFIDMAVTAARKALNDGNAPAGAVIVANGAWRATGIPSAAASAEENAIADLRNVDPAKATVYTLNYPSAAALAAIARAKIPTVVYVNTQQQLISANIAAPADFGSDPSISFSITLIQSDNADAKALIQNYQKNKK
jgi:deoxycytidylate deaminase